MFATLLSKLRHNPVREKRGELIIEPSRFQRDFQPNPEQLCFCGSGIMFSQCCGSRSELRSPPYGVFVDENYLSQSSARELRQIADCCVGDRLKVIHTSSSPGNMILVEDSRRVSDRLLLGEYQARINALVKTAFRQLTEKYFHRQLQWFELPQILRYKAGGYYVKHADSENYDMQTQTWSRTIDRDLSLLIYLNDDYRGGELFFEKFNYRLRPRAGMAVIFPSDHRYLHEAQTVTAGERYAIVSWGAVRGVPKIAPKPPDIALFYE